MSIVWTDDLAAIVWTDDLAAIDWNELSALYRIAPLGNKAPADLALVFGNSIFRAFAYDEGRLVGAGRALADGRDCAHPCDVAVHPDWQGRALAAGSSSACWRRAARIARSSSTRCPARRALRASRLPPNDDGHGDFRGPGQCL